MSDFNLAVQLASKWTTPENRRREGLRAAHSQDAETLIDLMHTYIRLKSSRRGRTSELTLKAYAESVRQFLNFTGPPDSPHYALNQLSAEVFELWLLQMQSGNLKPNTIKRHLYGVRNLMKALTWAGVLKVDPSAGISPPSDPTPAYAKKRALTQNQIQEMLSLPQSLHADDSIQANRDALLLLLGGTLGLRAAEIVGLDVRDIDTGTATVTVRGKGGKTRLVPMTSDVISALKEWLISRQSISTHGLERSPALLLSLSRNHFGGRLTTDGARFIAATYYKALGLPPEMWGLHTLRRTAGTHLYRATRDLHVVADLLGHSSVTTSAIYAKMDGEVRREAVEAMEKLRRSSTTQTHPTPNHQQRED